MTGNGHGDAVRGAGASHGSYRFRRADCLGNLRVARRRTGGDAAERIPHEMLKCGTADVQREGEVGAWIFHEVDGLGDQLTEGRIVADQLRARKLFLEVALEFIGTISEEDGAYAFFACGDEHQAERALADGKFYLRVGSTRAELARTHAEHLGRGRIEAAIGVEARAVDRLGDRGTPGKLLAHALVAVSPGIGLRGDTKGHLENAMEMVGT